MSVRAGYVAIVGRPNSGKSTLMNSILGSQLSVVTPKAQTTREQVLGIFSEDRGQIIFVDTPGIHRAKEGGINQFMVHEAQQALDAPDLVWYLVDPKSSMEHESVVIELLKKSSAPVIVILNKVDLQAASDGSFQPRYLVPQAQFEDLQQKLLQKLSEEGVKVIGARRISGLKQLETQTLLDETWTHIPEGQPFYPDAEAVSDRPVRYFVAEKIREQLLHLLGEEVPYSCAVEVEEFLENRTPVRIQAVIYVERESQKGIVIGQGGKKIKDIGTHARLSIEKFLDQKVFLGLKVKVLKDWSQNADHLRKLGYSLPPSKKRS